MTYLLRACSSFVRLLRGQVRISMGFAGLSANLINDSWTLELLLVLLPAHLFSLFLFVERF